MFRDFFYLLQHQDAVKQTEKSVVSGTFFSMCENACFGIGCPSHFLRIIEISILGMNLTSPSSRKQKKISKDFGTMSAPHVSLKSLFFFCFLELGTQTPRRWPS